MLSLAVVFRWISLIALGLALSSCSNVGFEGPRHQFSGVWLYEFEGSTFVEGATGIPAGRPAYKEADWLADRSGQLGAGQLADTRADVEVRDCNPVQPFLVTFVGRRTHRPFGAGHMGLWRSEVTVERMISFKRLGPAFCYGD
jgi:hypothetical protein